MFLEVKRLRQNLSVSEFFLGSLFGYIEICYVQSITRLGDDGNILAPFYRTVNPRNTRGYS